MIKVRRLIDFTKIDQNAGFSVFLTSMNCNGKAHSRVEIKDGKEQNIFCLKF